MAYRLVSNDEVEGLCESTHKGYTLLLPERHLPHPNVALVSYAQTVEPTQNLLLTLIVCQAVLYQNILQGSKFREEPQFLEEHANLRCAHHGPIAGAELPNITAVEKYLTAIVMSVTKNIAAKSTLSLTACRLDERQGILTEYKFLPPHL